MGQDTVSEARYRGKSAAASHSKKSQENWQHLQWVYTYVSLGFVVRVYQFVISVRGSWVVGRGSWVVGRGSWV